MLSITGARGEATGKEIAGEDAGSAGSSDQMSSGRGRVERPSEGAIVLLCSEGSGRPR